MEYAILTVDKEAVNRHLIGMGKSVQYENFSSNICVLKTDANLLDMKTVTATINNCDAAETCKARYFEKDLRSRKKIWSFLTGDYKMNVAVMKDI